ACPQGAAPDPRLANASGRRPSNLDRDRGSIITLSVKSIAISLAVNDGGCLTHNERNTNEIKFDQHVHGRPEKGSAVLHSEVLGDQLDEAQLAAWRSKPVNCSANECERPVRGGRFHSQTIWEGAA